ncbi:MAG: hypothetical protein JJE21_09590, partial [Spirochaetaceae bacterium]|nr:hypothetical protein [Spirochaetaceae bacterium]
RTLYNELGNRGVKDFDTKIKSLRLQPIFKRFGTLSTNEFILNLSNILKGKSNTKDIRKAILEVSQVYASLTEAIKEVTDYTKDEIGEVRTIKPKELLDNFNNFAKLFNESELLSNTALVMDEFDIITSSVLFSIPFVKTDSTMSEVNKIQAKLLLPYFYNIQLGNRGFKDANAVHVIQCGAVILSAHNILVDSNIKNFTKLFDDQAINDFILCNIYKDVTYYKKEALQELIILSALSLKLFVETDFDIDNYISTLLEIETNSGYHLKTFLAQIKEK